MIVRQEEFESTHSGLRILNMSVEYAGSSIEENSNINFTLSHDGSTIGTYDLGGVDVGLPSSRDEAYAHDSSNAYQAPADFVAFLQNALAGDDSPLYLAFASPSGYLPAVPWERLLVPHLQIPVLRLPGLPIRPITPQSNLTIAYCITLPIAKERQPPELVLNQFIDQLPTYNAMRAKSHVFADKQLIPHLERFKSRLAHSGAIEVHDPDNAAKYGVAARRRDIADRGNRFDSPWLLWMRDELAETGIDGVHFLCHGYLGKTRGGLSVAESPMLNEDLSSARFVGTRQLGYFLEELGAWCVFFSCPPQNYSPAGMRMLQNEMSAVLPLPTVIHEMDHDPQGAALQAAYPFVFDEKNCPPPAISGAISVVCPPSWILPDQSQGADHLNTLFDDLTLAGRMKEPLRQSATLPGWVTAAQRSLERAVANVSIKPSNSIEAAEQEGSESALRFMADLFASHAMQATTPNPAPVESEEEKK
ncbi:MAG TPA: hypothetical protein VKU19_36580 [Bryobacteraceae bacterium]|nr:hypothetical protein [Bryobacteraceae bacterium]